MQKAKPRGFAFLLFEEFSNFCLANAVEPLRAANRISGQELYRWQFLALGPGPVRSSSGLPVQPEARLRDHPGGDFLMVMPSYGHEALDTAATRAALRAAAPRFAGVVGLDTGSWLLASAGLLDGRRATTHWDVLTDLAERFPQVDVVDDRFVIDGNRASCGGASTTFDLMLHLIGAHHGQALALEVAALFMSGERGAADPLLRLPPSGILRAAAAIMRRNIEAPLAVPEIAARLGLGPRALQLVFRDGLGRSPGALYRTIRLAQARRWLRQSRLSVAEIATRCGYGDPAAMARAIRAEFGTTPTGLRKQALDEDRRKAHSGTADRSRP